jgi:hypothetical protein
MAMDYQLKKHLLQTVKIKPWSSTSSDGAHTYGTEVSYACRTTFNTKMATNDLGQEVVSHAQTIVDGTAVVNSKSYITLPDNTHPKVISVKEVADELGVLYYKEIYT